MRIECIAIGSELLTTQRLDTNSVWIAEQLASLGLAFHRKTAVGDSREDMTELFREALGRSELIVCTGGLGPTFDDFTKELWAELLGSELKEDVAAREALLAFFAVRQRTPSPSNFKQALIPEGAEAMPNPVGTAPGIWWEPAAYPGRRIALLPGVPREMKRMWSEQVMPRLASLAGAPVRSLRLVVGGLPESVAAERTAAVREKHGALEWTILASLSQVEFLARGSDPAALDAARIDMAAVLGPDLVGELNPEDTVLARLAARGETLAVAESVTGGLLASRLTAVPGASAAFLGGAVVYSARAKRELAGVDAELIAAHGTVSAPVTGALAAGLRARLGSSWALALTGNAGPTEDREGAAPVGTCFIALAGPEGVECQSLFFPAERADLQLRACAVALDLLRRKLGVSYGKA